MLLIWGDKDNWIINRNIMVSDRIEIGPSLSENTKVGHLPQAGVGGWSKKVSRISGTRTESRKRPWPCFSVHCCSFDLFWQYFLVQCRVSRCSLAYNLLFCSLQLYLLSSWKKTQHFVTCENSNFYVHILNFIGIQPYHSCIVYSCFYFFLPKMVRLNICNREHRAYTA